MKMPMIDDNLDNPTASNQKYKKSKHKKRKLWIHYFYFSSHVSSSCKLEKI